ncbi:MAG: TIGR02266 family protein [Myxococcaceae bacterium]
MDVELNKAEQELQNEEATLHAELVKLATVGAELAQRQGRLQARASAVGDQAMAQRASMAPPAVEETGLQAASAARAAAVKARREVNAGVRAQVAAAKQKLQKLAQQVMADEKAVAVAEQQRAQQAQANAGFEPVASAPAPRPSAPPPAAKTEPVPGVGAAAAAAAAAKKRQSPRVKMQAAVDFTSDNNFFNGFSANISDGGLFVATVNLLPLGTEVDLNFTLPSGQKIEARGVVRWVREVNDQLPDAFPGLGVQFANLNPTAQNAINEFLAQRDPLFFADAE